MNNELHEGNIEAERTTNALACAKSMKPEHMDKEIVDHIYEGLHHYKKEDYLNFARSIGYIAAKRCPEIIGNDNFISE